MTQVISLSLSHNDYHEVFLHQPTNTILFSLCFKEQAFSLLPHFMGSQVHSGGVVTEQPFHSVDPEVTLDVQKIPASSLSIYIYP